MHELNLPVEVYVRSLSHKDKTIHGEELGPGWTLAVLAATGTTAARACRVRARRCSPRLQFACAASVSSGSAACDKARLALPAQMSVVGFSRDTSTEEEGRVLCLRRIAGHK